ncbi:MAG: hypothetical protein R6V10_02865 [bacterium]
MRRAFSPQKIITSFALTVFFTFIVFYAPEGKGDNQEGTRFPTCPPVSIAPLVERSSILMKDEHFGEGSLEFFPGVAIVHLYGSSYERGYQHGAMLKAEINTAIESLQRSHPGSFEVFKTMSFYKDFLRRPRFLRQELLGMAEGAEASMWELIRLNRAYLEYGPIWQEDEDRAPRDDSPSFSVEELSRRRWHSAGIPGWMLVVHHPEGSPAYLVLSRPGAVFAMAGMRKSGCCLAGKDVWKNRSGLSQGVCGVSLPDAQNYCGLSFPEADRKIKAYFAGESGLVCLSRDRGQSFGALDMESFTFRPRCPACASVVERNKEKNESQ